MFEVTLFKASHDEIGTITKNNATNIKSCEVDEWCSILFHTGFRNLSWSHCLFGLKMGAHRHFTTSILDQFPSQYNWRWKGITKVYSTIYSFKVNGIFSVDIS